MSGNNTSQASSYEQKSKGQRNGGLDLIDMLKVEKGATVLDLGCGTGYLTKVLSERVGPEGKVVAVDPDGERLKIAREKYSSGNIEYIQADDKTFPAGQYDLVFSNAVIHWISDKEGLHKLVYNNLCAGGRFAFTTPDGFFPNPAVGIKLFDELVRPDFLHQMFHEKMILLNCNEYRNIATSAGFKNISTTVKSIDLQWSSLDSYIDAMYGWFQGEFDPKQFDKDKLDEIKQQHGDGPVVAPEPHRRLYVILTK